jgi:hypothetical protein
LLAFDSILLVREREAGTVEARDKLVLGECLSVLVMQRSVEGGIDSSTDREGDITEMKGLAAGVSGGGVEVFGRTEQPEEGEDDELDGMLLEVPKDWVIDVENREEFTDDGDVDRVGSRRWVVISFHGSVEISEYGMELACFRVDSRIWAVQVGEPLGHGGDSITNCASSDRFTLLAAFAVLETKDKEVAEDVFGKQGMQCAGSAFTCAEVGPDAEDLVGGVSAFGGCGCGGDTERSAEISCKALSCGSCSSRHGLGCGYSCWKWSRKAQFVRCCRREASSSMTLASPGRKCAK